MIPSFLTQVQDSPGNMGFSLIHRVDNARMTYIPLRDGVGRDRGSILIELATGSVTYRIGAAPEVDLMQ